MADEGKWGLASGKLFRIDEMTQLKSQVEVPIPDSRELNPSSVGGYLTITVAQAQIDVTCQILRLEYRDGVQYALLQLPWPGSKDESLTSRPTPERVCPTCQLPAEVPGEGRFCGSCEDYEGHCRNDHCMTCGEGT